MSDTEANVRDEEISLREIIEVIWNGKWIIILTTLVFMMASGIFSLFMMDPVYASSTTLMINDEGKDKEDTTVNSIEELLQKLQNPNLSLQTYVEQVKNPYVIQDVIKELGLDPEKYSIIGLQNSISVEAVKGTNLIRMKLEGSNPVVTTKIVNTWAQEFADFMTVKGKNQFMKSANHLNVQLQVDIENQQSVLTKTKAELSETPKYLVTSKSLSDDPFLQSVVEQRTNSSSTEAGQIEMKSEHINPIYNSLQSKLTNLNIHIAELQSKQQAVDKMKQKYAEEEVGKANITLSPALVPEHPTGPNKKLNVAIAMVVGGMLSVLVVFFRHYWRVSGGTGKNYPNENGLDV